MTAFMDGSRVTPGTAECKCDSPTPRPDGRARNCEWPCWQRLGLTADPCCPDCAPLPDPLILLGPRVHLRDAAFHLSNAVRSLEAAVDAAPDGQRFGWWQQVTGAARSVMRAVRAEERAAGPSRRGAHR